MLFRSLHNHPSNNNFSLADLYTFIQAGEIGLMSVITNQSEVHILRKSDIFDYSKIVKLATDAYDEYDAKVISHDEAVKRFLKGCKSGGVIYERSK